MFSNQPLHIWISSAEKNQKDVNLYYFLIAQSSLLFCLNVLPFLSKSWHQRHGYLS